MRKAKTLILPFFCEGYSINDATNQLKSVTALIEKADISTEVSPFITNVKEATEASLKYNPFCYDFVVLYISTWVEPRLAAIAARQFFGKPIAIWCVDEFKVMDRRIEMSAAPAAAALHGCLQEMGVLSEMFVGQNEDDKRDNRLMAFSSAARAITMLREAKFGFYGQNFNGITAADFDLSLLRCKFGTEVYTFDGTELVSRMENIDTSSKEYADMAKRAEKLIKGDTGEHFARIVKMCLALQNTIKDYDLAALDIRCHTEFSQNYGLSACVPLSILGNSLPCSCEADLPVMLTQYILYALSGGKTSAYVDLRTFGGDTIDAGACGYAPSALTGDKIEISGSEAPGNQNPPGYIANRSGFNEGRITLARVLKMPGGKLALHICGADASKIDSPLQEMGCPYYPMVKIKPDISMDRFLSLVGANHYALIYDEIMPAAFYFCRYTGIDLIK
ncbi:MAG: hypothetical protein IKF53_00450 [Clostridia bacterium]|nr:hypothetical protein [Clostridia bacterium]